MSLTEYSLKISARVDGVQSSENSRPLCRVIANHRSYVIQ
jgi:hypothetical protein